MRELPEAEPIPLEALGSLRGAAEAIHDKTQAPLAICAQSVLGAATLAVQGHADVLLPTGQSKSLSCFFVSVAASGERKSACDNEALWPVKQREHTLREAYRSDDLRWRNEQDAWESQRRQILANKKQYPDAAAKKHALDVLGSAPQAPLIPMLTCTEPTFEGLVRLYATGHPSLGMFSAEGGQFIGGHGMSEEKKLLTATAFPACGTARRSSECGRATGPSHCLVAACPCT